MTDADDATDKQPLSITPITAGILNKNWVFSFIGLYKTGFNVATHKEKRAHDQISMKNRRHP